MAVAGLVLAASVALGAVPQSNGPAVVPGNEACSGCHAEIAKSYSKTIMARASGIASDGLITGGFLHQKSGVRYRIFQRDNRTWMSYERDGEAGFHGERELLYFIGSGEKGRSYLFSRQGFLFETPINWYSQEGRWNMAPAYTEAQTIPMTLPSLTDCLNCHVSGLRLPVAGTENRFAGKPFLHAGITCERCHGSGEGHLEKGAGRIVNPAKLPPQERDSVCMECHFEGDVAVKQPGKHLYNLQPGERLSDYIHYFLLKGNSPTLSPNSPFLSTKESDKGRTQVEEQALSQVEALSLSVCKVKSGDRMSCLSCHDPHDEPTVAERPAYFRAKCLVCHGQKFAARHRPDKPDCTSCHMPALPSRDVAHTQATDHRILKYPGGRQFGSLSAGLRLEAFPASEASGTTTRDLALAWQTLAERKVQGAASKAEEYLRKAIKERPEDPVLLSALGYVEQQHGRENEARELYQRTLKIDPLANEAATNLGVLEARAGHLEEAVRLWQRAFERMPHRSEVGMNLATLFCASGQTEDAKRYVSQVLEFNPDSQAARRLKAGLEASPAKCK
jgi:hypothetical protein